MVKITRKRNYKNKKKSVKRKIIKGGGALKKALISIIPGHSKIQELAEKKYKNIFDQAKKLKTPAQKKDFMTKLKKGIDPTTNKVVEKNAKKIVEQIELEGTKKNLGQVIDVYPKPICGGTTGFKCPNGFKQVTMVGGGVWKSVKQTIIGAVWLYVLARALELAGVDI